MTDKHVGAVIVHQHDLVIRLRIIFPQNVYQHVVDVPVAVVGAKDDGESNIKRKAYPFLIEKGRLNDSRKKLKYLNNRLGLNMSYDEVRRLKIILNLYDLLNENNINLLTRDKQVCDQLNDYFLGFLSIDNSCLNMRRVVDAGRVMQTIDKRYVNYKLFKNNEMYEKFYTIPTSIDLLSPVNIHIAEGPMDILSIYKNLRHEEQGIYTSVGGNNYLGQVLYFISVFKLPFAIIHIYPDNDKYGSYNYINKETENLKDFIIKARIKKMENQKVTKVETKILVLLAHGKSNSIIADELFISPHTVKAHLENIKNNVDDDGHLMFEYRIMKHCVDYYTIEEINIYNAIVDYVNYIFNGHIIDTILGIERPGGTPDDPGNV